VHGASAFHYAKLFAPLTPMMEILSNSGHTAYAVDRIVADDTLSPVRNLTVSNSAALMSQQRQCVCNDISPTMKSRFKASPNDFASGSMPSTKITVLQVYGFLVSGDNVTD